MSRFPERDASALVVVDAQQGPAAALAGVTAVLDAIADLVARARLVGVPVVWLRRVDAELRPGEPGWQLCDLLASEPGELLIDHAWDDGFIATDLADALGGLSAGHLWLAGLGSETAVLQTYLGALYRGFDVTLIEDAHAATDVEFDGCELSASQVVALVNRHRLARPGPRRQRRPDGLRQRRLQRRRTRRPGDHRLGAGRDDCAVIGSLGAGG